MCLEGPPKPKSLESLVGQRKLEHEDKNGDDGGAGVAARDDNRHSVRYRFRSERELHLKFHSQAVRTHYPNKGAQMWTSHCKRFSTARSDRGNSFKVQESVMSFQRYSRGASKIETKTADNSSKAHNDLLYLTSFSNLATRSETQTTNSHVSEQHPADQT